MLSNVPLTIAGTGGTSEGERGLAAGLLNSSIQLGNAWGLGVVATVVAAVTTARRGGSQLRGTRRWLAVGLYACAGFAVLACRSSFWGCQETNRRPNETLPRVGKRMSGASRSSRSLAPATYSPPGERRVKTVISGRHRKRSRRCTNPSPRLVYRIMPATS